MKWYQTHNFFFFVKLYASVPLRKMKKFIKKRKKVVKSREYKNLGQKLFAQLQKQMIQLLDVIAQQILILGLKMIT